MMITMFAWIGNDLRGAEGRPFISEPSQAFGSIEMYSILIQGPGRERSCRSKTG